MAISDETNHQTVFLDPDSGQRQELAGWVPLAWSPDGQQLIVADAAERKALAVVDAATLGNVEPLGRTKSNQFQSFVWLPLGASAGGTLPVGRPAADGGR
jgi:hypothetical protein